MANLSNPVVTVVSHFAFVAVLYFTGAAFFGLYSDIIPLLIFFFAIPIVGPIGVLHDPHSMIFKIGYFIVMLTLVFTYSWGVMKRSKWWGHMISIGSMLVWWYCSMLGMNA